MEEQVKKRAIAFGGGGARGSYEVGVWQALKEMDFSPEVVVGTSVGSLNACLFAQGSIEEAMTAWKEIEEKGIFSIDLPDNLSSPDQTRSALLNLAKGAVKGGGVGYEPLSDFLNKYVNEEEVRESAIRFGLMTTKFPILQAKPLFIDEIPEGQLKEYLLASCACFPAMKPYTIDGTQYVDGGYSDNVPLGMAISQGAEEIVAVDLKSPGFFIPHSIPAGTKVIRINRLWDLGQLLLFDRARTQRNMRLGYLETKKAFNLLDGYKYTFVVGDFEKAAKGELGTKARTILYKWRFFGLLFPEVHGTSMGENRVLSTVRDLLGKDINDVKNIASFLMAGAEALGLLLQISPLPIYTVERFTQAIALMSDKTVEKTLDKGQIMASEVELFLGNTKINRNRNQQVSAQIYQQLISTPNPSSKDRAQMDSRLLLSPMEFLEALYAVASGVPLSTNKEESK